MHPVLSRLFGGYEYKHIKKAHHIHSKFAPLAAGKLTCSLILIVHRRAPNAINWQTQAL